MQKILVFFEKIRVAHKSYSNFEKGIRFGKIKHSLLAKTIEKLVKKSYWL